MLSAVCLEETEALSISVTHEDPQTAMEMVNAILDTAPAEILRIVHTGGMEIIDRAGLPERPDAPSAWQNGVLGAFLGALVACLVSVWAGFGEKKRRLSRLRRRPGGRFSPTTRLSKRHVQDHHEGKTRGEKNGAQIGMAALGGFRDQLFYHDIDHGPGGQTQQVGQNRDDPGRSQYGEQRTGRFYDPG